MEILSFFDTAYQNAKVYNENKELLKEIILVCALDFLRERRHMQTRLPDNIFFHRKKEVMLILQTDKEIFFYLYNNINLTDIQTVDMLQKYDFMQGYALHEMANEYIQKGMNEEVVLDMKRDGASVVSSMFSADEIAEIRYYYNQKLLNTTSGNSEFYELEGRQRSYWETADRAPAIIRKLFYHDKIADIVSSYIGVEAKCSLILAEKMTSPKYAMSTGLHWHVDNLSDQVKVMIPLSDINHDNAPMEYMPKSQDSNSYDDALSARIHHIYQMAHIKTAPDCLVEDYFADNLEYTRNKACCRAGDAVFFDTRLMHRGNICKIDTKRENLVLIFNTINTKRNRLFRYLYNA